VRKFLLVLVLLVFSWIYLVPSCSAKFGCDALGVAWADGDRCPAGIQGAAVDPAWAADRLATIQGESETFGLFYDEDGAEVEFKSGRGGDADRVVKILTELGKIPQGTRPYVVDHVETKVAALMRQEDVTSGVLVINKKDGVCTGDMSCTAFVKAILPAGSMLVVWSPVEIGAGRALTLRGDS